MGRDDFTNALQREDNGGRNDEEGDDDRGHRFGLAVTVGMLGIRRRGRDFQAVPNDERSEDIERRFDSVGNQRVGMTENTGDDFGSGKNEVDRQTEQREARSGAKLILIEADCRTGHEERCCDATWPKSGR